MKIDKETILKILRIKDELEDEYVNIGDGDVGDYNVKQWADKVFERIDNRRKKYEN
jgi:hypothetical protein